MSVIIAWGTNVKLTLSLLALSAAIWSTPAASLAKFPTEAAPVCPEGVHSVYYVAGELNRLGLRTQAMLFAQELDALRARVVLPIPDEADELWIVYDPSKPDINDPNHPYMLRLIWFVQGCEGGSAEVPATSIKQPQPPRPGRPEETS